MKLALLVPVLTGIGIVAGGGAERRSRESVDILITGGTVITMDSARRVLEDGAVAIRGDRIVAVGATRDLTERFSGRDVIDARRTIIMPGLIDGHGHAGHQRESAQRRIGGGDGRARSQAQPIGGVADDRRRAANGCAGVVSLTPSFRGARSDSCERTRNLNEFISDYEANSDRPE